MATLTSAIPRMPDPEHLSHVKRRTPAGDAVRTLRQRPFALAGLSILVAWIVLAVLAPVLPLEAQDGHVEIQDRLLAPSADHPFGTDDTGRDVLSRVIFAARTSVPAGFVVVFFALAIGGVLGAFSGYMGGVVDAFLMRACDAVLSFPSIILA